MKIIAFTFAVLLAGVSAVPDFFTRQTNERFIDNIIIGVIEDMSNTIKERGLDPMNFEGASFEYKLPVTDLLTAEAAIEGVLLEGLSNIKVNRVNYSLLTSRLQLDISLPLIAGEIGSSHAAVKFFSTELSGKVSGSLSIKEIRLVADVRLNIGIISGISIRSLDIDFSVAAVESDLIIVVFGHDLSASINKFLGETITNALEENKEDINSLLEHIVTLIVESLL